MVITKACAQTSGDDETCGLAARHRLPEQGNTTPCAHRPSAFNSPAGSRSPTHQIKAHLKRKPHAGDDDCVKRARRHREEALDGALKNTFPASDPVSIEHPARGMRVQLGRKG
jgi:hypothetical protein